MPTATPHPDGAEFLNAMRAAALAAVPPREYTRKPMRDDILAATWPADPLTPEEVAEAERLGVDLVDGGNCLRWPAFNAMTRQALAGRRPDPCNPEEGAPK